MGRVVAGLASSHAFTFIDPHHWDDLSERNRQLLQQRSGVLPPVQDRANRETLTGNQEKYASIRGALNHLRELLLERRPDALVVIGDDQNENFTSANIPQLAVHVGDRFRLASPLASSEVLYRVHRGLATAILEQGVRAGFDIASLGSFANNELKSHAHAQILADMLPHAEIPVVLVFVNAIHYPAVEPWRCEEFGRLLADVIRNRPKEEKFAIYASGGWSHFTAGYPWKDYRGPHTHGAIDLDFDSVVRGLLESGNGRKLAEFSATDLLDHGEVELRALITLIGALGDLPTALLEYHPFYRALMGMAVVSWIPEPQRN